MIIEPPYGRNADRKVDYVLGVVLLDSKHSMFHREDNPSLCACLFKTAGDAIEWLEEGDMLSWKNRGNIMIVPAVGRWAWAGIHPRPFIPF